MWEWESVKQMHEFKWCSVFNGSSRNNADLRVGGSSPQNTSNMREDRFLWRVKVKRRRDGGKKRVVALLGGDNLVLLGLSERRAIFDTKQAKSQHPEARNSRGHQHRLFSDLKEPLVLRPSLSVPPINHWKLLSFKAEQQKWRKEKRSVSEEIHEKQLGE